MGSDTLEGKSLGLPDLECVRLPRTLLVVPHLLSDLAWEITATGIERRVVQSSKTIWNWLGHDDVGISKRSGQHRCNGNDRL